MNRIQSIAGKISNLPTKGFAWISAGALVIIIILTATDVTMRAAVHKPVTGAYEVSQLLMVFVAAFAFAYTQVKRQHIPIPVLVDRFPKRVQAVIESIGWIIGCALFALVAWQSAVHGVELINAGAQTLALLIPMGPFYFVLVAGFALFSLTLLANFVESLARIRK